LIVVFLPSSPNLNPVGMDRDKSELEFEKVSMCKS
jgi:hypothetical protein